MSSLNNEERRIVADAVHLLGCVADKIEAPNESTVLDVIKMLRSVADGSSVTDAASVNRLPAGEPVANGERIASYELLRRGGEWLGVAREWVKWHKRNGDRVTWGSSDELQPPMTIREVEELAAEVAASAHSTLAELRDALFAAVEGDVDPDEQLIDTLKRIVRERDAAWAGKRALEEATSRLVDVNDEMGQVMFFGGTEDDPKAWGELVVEANAALDACRKLLPKATAKAASVESDPIEDVDRGSAPDGSQMASSNSTEGARAEGASLFADIPPLLGRVSQDCEPVAPLMHPGAHATEVAESPDPVSSRCTCPSDLPDDCTGMPTHLQGCPKLSGTSSAASRR